jgi:hypothetical protein
VLSLVFAVAGLFTTSVLGIYLACSTLNGIVQATGWPGNGKLMASWFSSPWQRDHLLMRMNMNTERSWRRRPAELDRSYREGLRPREMTAEIVQHMRSSRA